VEVYVTDGQVNASKAGSVWALTGVAWWLESIGIQNWGDVAAMLAALYSLLLIIQWFWKLATNWRKRDADDGQ
jgi:hypothetical protein